LPEGASRRGRRVDLAVGILLGILLGVAVISAFVFLESEDTIDAPRISAPVGERDTTPEPAREAARP
jgi:hypothetical protein